jgi:hypothetical protein
MEHGQSFANVTSSRYAAGTRSGIPRFLDSGPAVKYLIGSSHVLNTNSDLCDLRVFAASNQPVKNVPSGEIQKAEIRTECSRLAPGGT